MKQSNNLYLFYPAWQGSGETNEIYFGALQLKNFLDNFSFLNIPVVESEKLIVEENILGYRSILTQLEIADTIISKAKPEKIFTLGGGCDVDIAPVSYLNNIYEENLAIIWFDAHGDLNTPESSPSKNFHGMPLRLLFGEGNKQLLKQILKPLVKNQLFLIGTRDLDDPEKDFLLNNDIAIYNENNILSTLNASSYKKVYIHIDLDVLNPLEFPAVKCPTPDGLSIDALKSMVQKIKISKEIVGASILEYVSNEDNKYPTTVREIFDLLIE